MTVPPETSAERLEIRIHNPSAQPTLIYLPGLHGDWTLVSSFRRALGGRARFVELTYPRTLTWSIDDYAAAVESALRDHGITRGWLLGESFGSQIVWPLAARRQFQVEGAILAGGFVRHPMRWAARMVKHIAGGVSLHCVIWIMFSYAKLARFRYRHSPETLAGIEEFISRRTELDRQAATHRLHLLAENDPCSIAREIGVPVFALTGLIDPIVPWPFVRPWLKRHCPALRDYKIIWRADHNVLGTAPEAAAEQVWQWMNLK